MRSLILIGLILMSVAEANVCSRAWEDKHESCQLLWQDQDKKEYGIELVYISNNCYIHEGDKPISCLQVRDCRAKDSQHERFIYLEQQKIDFLCQNEGERKLYGEGEAPLKDVQVILHCKKGKAERVVLKAAGKEKNCSFLGSLKVRP